MALRGGYLRPNAARMAPDFASASTARPRALMAFSWSLPRQRHETRDVPDPSTERSGITMEQSGVYAVLLIVLVIFATYIGSYILDL